MWNGVEVFEKTRPLSGLIPLRLFHCWRWNLISNIFIFHMWKIIAYGYSTLNHTINISTHRLTRNGAALKRGSFKPPSSPYIENKTHYHSLLFCFELVLLPFFFEVFNLAWLICTPYFLKLTSHILQIMPCIKKNNLK